MSIRRVVFSKEEPGVAYVPPVQPTGGSLVADLFASPLPPPHREDNFEMDAHTAASIGDTGTLQTLLSRSTSLLSVKNRSGWTPLLYAAYLGHEPVVQILLDAGAQIDECNSRGQTALMLASACGNLSTVRLLIKRGASVSRADADDRIALHYAASCSQNTVVDALLAAGADANACDRRGMTPTLETCASGHELTFLSLVEKGGDPSLRNNAGEDGVALAADCQKMLQLIEGAKKDGGKGPATLAQLLDEMNLSRLTEKFERERIDLPLFFDLEEKDLEEMGIPYGPKKRVLAVIERYKKTGQICTDTFDLPSGGAAAASQPQPAQPPSDHVRELFSSLRHVHGRAEDTKSAALSAIDALRGSDKEAELLPLLARIIDNSEQMTSRIVRHTV